ncbi:hypothetical protein SAMN03080601_02278 [Alkalitalea saponilacus]|uniref:Uncharacterized protein n=1 Tax=Alkalitalea saponilacus TaxID=889453 RepID=A0A1T5HFQ4_9BACT|nr:hypothetical protein SAMN03080601_02278 [Alkalitalea saponilacus]
MHNIKKQGHLFNDRPLVLGILTSKRIFLFYSLFSLYLIDYFYSPKSFVYIPFNSFFIRRDLCKFIFMNPHMEKEMF